MGKCTSSGTIGCDVSKDASVDMASVELHVALFACLAKAKHVASPGDALASEQGVGQP